MSQHQKFDHQKSDSVDSAGSAGSAVRRIPLPTGDKQPLKVNIFEKMQSGNTQLMPLFPYFDAGAIVPCGAIFRGEPEAEFGHFFHWNSEDEVAVVFGAEGALLKTGQVMALGNLHGVNSFLKDPTNPDSFLVTTITQRQSTGAAQKEALIIRCRKCNEQVLRIEYDAPPLASDAPPLACSPQSGETADAYPGFTTIAGSLRMAETYNASDEQRTCPNCGTVNQRFPLERWGWGAYVTQGRTVNDARRALDAAARAQSA